MPEQIVDSPKETLAIAAANLQHQMDKGLEEAGFMLIDFINLNREATPETDDSVKSGGDQTADQTRKPIEKIDARLDLSEEVSVYAAHCRTPSEKKTFFYLRVEWPKEDQREAHDAFVHYIWDVNDTHIRARLVNFPPPIGNLPTNDLSPRDIGHIQKILDISLNPTAEQVVKLSEELKQSIREEVASTDPVLISFYERAVQRGLPEGNPEYAQLEREIMEMYGLSPEAFHRARTRAIGKATGTRVLKELISGQA